MLLKVTKLETGGTGIPSGPLVEMFAEGAEGKEQERLLHRAGWPRSQLDFSFSSGSR